MRIIAGRLGGRIFGSPKSTKTHPMSDRARGGLFNTLGDIDGLMVLDAFAGSGALSFEAVSRGAQSTLAIESDRQAQKVIAENIESLGLGQQVKLIKTSANAWLTTAPKVAFDVVLCDPPYDDLQQALLTKLAKTVKPAGLLVLSWPGKAEALSFENFEIAVQHNYGDIQLVFYRRTSSIAKITA